jgi:hypothetical protein
MFEKRMFGKECVNVLLHRPSPEWRGPLP